MNRFRRMASALLSLALAACGTSSSTPSTPDAGARPDAGLTAADAGAEQDAGAAVDAGAFPDAGADEADASEPSDAGEQEADAGTPTPADAGDPMSGMDGGSVDAADAGYWTNVAFDGGAPYPACVGTAWPLEGATHVPEDTTVSYARVPPASGNHWGCWPPWTTSTRVLPPERWVHNLEHGGIALLYRCDPPVGGFASDAFVNGASPCPAEAQAIQQFLSSAPTDAAGLPRYVVTAAPGLPTRFAAVSWGWTLERDTFDAAEFSCFAAAHLAQGPEPVAVEPSPAACPQVYPP
jgi:hypothetical protein